ncbi:MAG: hypothetical protein MHPSP_001641, partial [Paramarteilia canceri]
MGNLQSKVKNKKSETKICIPSRMKLLRCESFFNKSQNSTYSFSGNNSMDILITDNHQESYSYFEDDFDNFHIEGLFKLFIMAETDPAKLDQIALKMGVKVQENFPEKLSDSRINCFQQIELSCLDKYMNSMSAVIYLHLLTNKGMHLSRLFNTTSSNSKEDIALICFKEIKKFVSLIFCSYSKSQIILIPAVVIMLERFLSRSMISFDNVSWKKILLVTAIITVKTIVDDVVEIKDFHRLLTHVGIPLET